MGASALVPPDVIGKREFAAACAAVVLIAGTFFAALLYLPQFFQKVLDGSPLEAGLALLPLMATFAVVSFVAGWLYGRLGAKRILCAGASLVVAGMLLLSLLGADASYAETVPGMLVLGAGFGLFFSTITTAAVTALQPSRASLGGAILYMFQVAGGSIGLALTTTIFARASQAQLSSDLSALGARAADQDVRGVQGILAGTDSGKRVAEQLPGQVATIEHLVRDAFVHGMSVAFRVEGVLALVGLVVTVLFVGGALRLRHGAIDDAAGASR
jgi:MFS family permease